MSHDTYVASVMDCVTLWWWEWWGGLGEHVEDTRLRAVFHCIPFSKSAPSLVGYSFPDTSDYSHLITVQIRYKYLFFGYLQFSSLCPSFSFPSIPPGDSASLTAPAPLKDWRLMSVLPQLTAAHPLPTAAIKVDSHQLQAFFWSGIISFQYSIPHSLGITPTSVYFLCFIRIQVVSMVYILWWCT